MALNQLRGVEPQLFKTTVIRSTLIIITKLKSKKMYIGKTELHPHYSNYNIMTKNSLIRYIYNCIESIQKKNKIIKELYFKINKLEEKIEDLQEFITFQNDEINKILYYKKETYYKIETSRKTYLMKDEYNGLYKIGSSKNPEFRESTLQSEKPSIKIVKVWNKDIEKHLHQKYYKNRKRGEWFDLTKVQIKYICTHF